LDCVSLDDAYRGDLDGNGIPDYVFVGVNPFGNGRLAPPGQITILLMDSNGLPSPHEINFYLDFHGPPPQLVDLDHDGRAELIVSAYDEWGWDARVGPSCSGHWTHRLFQIKDLKWVQFEGPIAGLTFPLIHRWTHCCKECPVSETRWPVHSQTSTKYLGEIDGQIDKVLDGGLGVRVTPLSGCKIVRPSIAVLDKLGSRQIVFSTGRSDYLTSLLVRIRNANAKISLRQVEQIQDECRASVLWATENQ